MVLCRAADAKAPPIAILVPEPPGTEELIPFPRRIDQSPWSSNTVRYGLSFANRSRRLSARAPISPIVARALPRLPKPPVAVLVVSAFGVPPDIRAWEDVEDTHGVPVVFDAAAALRSLDAVGYQPLRASSHATKLFAIGEGGAVLSTSSDLTE